MSQILSPLYKMEKNLLSVLSPLKNQNVDDMTVKCNMYYNNFRTSTGFTVSIWIVMSGQAVQTQIKPLLKA